MPDMVLADAIAHAIGAVPGVAGLGQGLFAKAATYGPGKHIAGVVLQHLAPGELSVEIHVVLDEAACMKALSELAPGPTKTPILLRFTESIRNTVSQTLEHLGLSAPSAVNVTIDDIR
jgi:uncharacterized alkaline shock family protein YloU